MKAIDIRRWSIPSILSIVMTWGIYTMPALAQVRQIDLIINSNSSQTFESLIKRAENVAKTSIDQEFVENSNVREVTVTILGERNGQMVPILMMKVSRFDWQAEPSIQQWVRYLGDSEILLGFKEPPVSESASRTSTTGFNNGRGNFRRRRSRNNSGNFQSEDGYYDDGRGFDDQDD
ncbi:MAG: hypothetical protein F6K16_20240 [Symploca sp. SIO2B6]|nr:hypothetical protein [Symploca sp. SIO2B6]